MTILLAIIVILHTCISTQIWAAEQHGHCLMYGHCKEDSPELFCAHTRAPEPLEPFEGEKNNSNAVKLLKEHCPDFAEGENPHVCCTTKTLMHLVELADLARLLGYSRCPSCLHNTIKLPCHVICNPRQSTHFQISETTKLDSGKEKVEAITLYISKKTADEYFASCKNMRGLLPGTYLLDYGLCGTWGYKNCTLERFLDFQGRKIEDGGFSPYTAHFILTVEEKIEVDGRTMYPVNFHAKKCSESPGPGEDACFCSDCEEACLKENLDPPQLPPTPQSSQTTPQSFQTTPQSFQTTPQSSQTTPQSSQTTRQPFQILGWGLFVFLAVIASVGFVIIRKNRKRKHESRLQLRNRILPQNLGPLIEVRPLRKKSDWDMNNELLPSSSDKASLFQIRCDPPGRSSGEEFQIVQ